MSISPAENEGGTQLNAPGANISGMANFALVTAGLRRQDHRFYAAMSIGAACTVLAGFGRSFYFKSYFHTAALPPVLHIHAALCTCWILLFIAQTLLVGAGRVRIHKMLGWIGAGLAVLVCIASVPAAIYAARRGHFAPAHDAYTSLLAFDFRNLFNFALMMSAAIYWRREREAHARLALVAAVALFADPAIGRIPGLAPAMMLVLFLFFYLAGPAYDLITRRRIHKVYWWGVPYLLGSIAVSIFAARSPIWHSVADWLMA